MYNQAAPPPYEQTGQQHAFNPNANVAYYAQPVGQPGAQPVAFYGQQPQYAQQYAQPQYAQPQYAQQPQQFLGPSQQVFASPVHASQGQPGHVVLGMPVAVPMQQYSAGKPSAPGGHGDSSIQGSDGRFDYANSQWRDLPFLLLFVGHLIIMIVLAIVFGPAFVQSVKNSPTPSSSTPSQPTQAPQSTTSASDERQIIAIIVAMAALGGAFAAVWLSVMRRFAENIIRFTIVFSIIGNIVAAIICFAAGVAGLGVLFIIMCILSIVYYYIVRNKIPFTAALLDLACQVLQEHPGSIYVSYVMMVAQVAWVALWIFVWASVGHRVTNGFVYFLLLLSLYWTSCVISNIVHVTCAGSAATWFFQPAVHDVTLPAFKRATTTSLGSICAGSLLVSIITTLRSMLRLARERDGCACFVDCILSCLEGIVRFINYYSFVYVAVYGKPYFQAARETWDLLQMRGFDIIVNDDLTDHVLLLGSFLSGIVTAVVASLWSSSFTSAWLGFGLLSFLIGAIMCSIALSVVKSAVVSILICFAENPAELASTRPAAYARLKSATHAQYGDQFNNYFI